MLFPSLKKTVSSRLGIKSILAVMLLISIISTILTSFFILRQKKLLTNELHTRIQSIARNLAYNSRDYIFTGNTEKLYALAKGIRQEKDVLEAQIIDCNGKIIAHNNWQLIGEFNLSAVKDSVSEETWIPFEERHSERVIFPIDIDGKFITRNSDIIYSPHGKTAVQDSTIFMPGLFIDPSFTRDSQSVTFSSLKYDHGDRVISSINIYNFEHRILVEGYSHNRWSHDGQFLTFSNEKELAVYNIASKEFRILCNRGIGRIGYPDFTHDDAYLITTLQANPPDIHSEKLFRIPLKGGDPEQLTYHKGQHWNPSCSPDGEWIVYTDISTFCLYLYNIKTEKSSRLFPDLSTKHNSGKFSPDGSKICFFLEIEGHKEIFITKFPLEKEKQTRENKYGTQLTSNGGDKRMMTDWSPDDKWITYVQDWNINIISTGGGNPINLTESLAKREILGYIVLDVSFESMNKILDESTRSALLISIIMISVGSLCAIILVRKVVRPVQNIADATTKVAQGDFGQTVSVTRNDEIGVLAESFNTMTGQLQNYREEIETWNLELETKVTERTAELAEKHEELEKAYKELETLDKAKDDFLSLVSHELRTPMSSILVFSEMLLNGVINSKEKVDHIHATIIKNCNRLSRLINDVLDLSKIEAGRMVFKREVLNIQDMIEETVGGFQSLIENRSITVDYRNVPDDIYFLGDRDRVTQVLANILSNAIKFNSDNGTITIDLSSNSTVGTISIQDTGKGIPKDDIPKVFDRFHQLDTIDHHINGTGLGMSISKSIIERQGGRIWIESEPGKGTTVFFTLPLADDYTVTTLSAHDDIAPDTKIQRKLLKEQSHCKILIADDDEEIRMALKECVTSAGYMSFEAGDGNETLRMVESHKPDLIILDVMMRGLSGLDVCRKLKGNPATRDIKILMLSARGQEREKEEGLQAGADRYISKPFNYINLLETIWELLKD